MGVGGVGRPNFGIGRFGAGVAAVVAVLVLAGALGGCAAERRPTSGDGGSAADLFAVLSISPPDARGERVARAGDPGAAHDPDRVDPEGWPPVAGRELGRIAGSAAPSREVEIVDADPMTADGRSTILREFEEYHAPQRPEPPPPFGPPDHHGSIESPESSEASVPTRVRVEFDLADSDLGPGVSDAIVISTADPEPVIRVLRRWIHVADFDVFVSGLGIDVRPIFHLVEERAYAICRANRVEGGLQVDTIRTPTACRTSSAHSGRTPGSG